MLANGARPFDFLREIVAVPPGRSRTLEREGADMTEKIRRRMRILTGALAALLVAGGITLAAGAAVAHGGPIGAQAGPNGGGGVYVYIFYERDLHAVDHISSATVTGESEGTTVGPIELTAAADQVGRWETPSDTFTDGRWELTVRYNEHGRDGGIDQPISVTVTGSSGQHATAGVDVSGVWPYLLAGGLAAALAGVVVAVAVRRRALSRTNA